jgi:hypothetical protein
LQAQADGAPTDAAAADAIGAAAVAALQAQGAAGYLA